MRSNEERVAEVKRRIEQNKRQEELQRSRIVMASVVAASLLVIAGLSAFMPWGLPVKSVRTAIPTMG